MKKKPVFLWLSSALLASALTFQPTPTHAANQDFTIEVEDKLISFDPQPFLENDRLMVPLRSLSEALGAEVSYDGVTHVATVKKGDITLVIKFRTGEVLKNGVAVTVSPAPKLVNDRTMVPLRFISELFTNKVDWYSATNKVTVFASEATLKSREQIKNVLLKSTQVTKQQNSFQMTMTVDGKFPVGPFTAKLDGNMQFDAIRDPMTMHGIGTIEMTVGPQVQDMKLEMYMKDGLMYILDPIEQKWVKTELITKENWEEFVNLNKAADPDRYAAQIAPLLPYYSMNEDNNYYYLTTSLDKIGIHKIMETAAQQTATELDMLNNMRIMVSIDKKTSLQKDLVIEYNLNVPDIGPVKITLKGEVLNYNNVPAIVIPQEVLNNAVEMPLVPGPTN